MRASAPSGTPTSTASTERSTITVAASGRPPAAATASTVSRTEAPLVRMSSTSTIRSSATHRPAAPQRALPGTDRLGENAAHGVPKPLLQMAGGLEGEQHAAGGGADHQRRVVRVQ